MDGREESDIYDELKYISSQTCLSLQVLLINRVVFRHSI